MARPLLPVLAVLVLAPALSGCFLFPPAPPEGPESRLEPAPFVAEAVNLSLDSPYGRVRYQGAALALAVKDAFGGGAVYFGANLSWRTDAIFQIREQGPVVGELYVMPPAGTWAGLRQTQAWRPASDADVAAGGFNGTPALVAAAAKYLPSNPEAPGSRWLLNGTISATFDGPNMALGAPDAGPHVFQRNASDFLVLEANTIIHYSVTNRSLDASLDGILRAVVLDPGLASIDASWGPSFARITVSTPSFRVQDLQINEEPRAKIFTATYPGVVELAAIRWVSRDVGDNLVRLRTANMTLCAGPGCD